MATSKPIYVRKARKDQGKCGKCGTEIRRGDAYLHWKFQYPNRTMKRCDSLQCRPTSADLESNSKRANHIRAQEAFGDFVATNYGSESALSDAISHVEEVIAELEESLSGWEGTSLASSQQYYDFKQSKSDLEEWVGNAQSAIDNWEPCDGSICEGIDFDEDVPDLQF